MAKYICKLAIVWSLASRIVAAEDEVELSSDIVKSLRVIEQSLSPITVKWTQSFTPADRSPQDTLKQLGDSRNSVDSFFGESTHTLKVQDGSAYYAYRKPMSGKNPTKSYLEFEFGNHRGVCFIGQHIGTSASHIPSLIKAIAKSPESRVPEVVCQESKYFEAAGYAFPRIRTAMPSIESGVLSLLARGGHCRRISTQVGENKSFVSVEMVSANPDQLDANATDVAAVEEEFKHTIDPPDVKAELLRRIYARKSLPALLHTTFVLDPTMHFAVVSWSESYPDGRVRRSSTCSNFWGADEQQFRLPTKCEVSYFEYLTRPGEVEATPLVREVFQNVSFSLERMPEEQFVLEYRYPGTRVRDETLPEAKTSPDGAIFYTIPATPEDLDKVIEAARQGKPPFVRGSRRQTWVVALVIANIAVVLFSLIWIVAKRRFGANKT